MVGITTFTMVVTSVAGDFPERKFPFTSSFDYKCPSLTQFFAIYSCLIFTNIILSCTTIGIDTLISGLMLYISTQLRILKCRLKKMPELIDETMRKIDVSQKGDYLDENDPRSLEKEIITNCIVHHCTIFELADLLRDNFASVMFLQFSITSMAMCFSVLELTKMRVFSPEFIFTTIYLTCVTIQIFLFCWYGNVMILESLDIADATYEMDWTSFTNSTKKTLLMIMARSLNPIMFTTGHVIVLSIDSYNSLIKLSYSAYNVLSQRNVD